MFTSLLNRKNRNEIIFAADSVIMGSGYIHKNPTSFFCSRADLLFYCCKNQFVYLKDNKKLA